jgi:uncharacterized protein
MFRTKLLIATVTGLLLASTSLSAKADDQLSSEKEGLIKQVLDASRATRNAQLGYELVIAQAVRGMNTALEMRIDQDTKMSADEKAQAKKTLIAQLDKRMDRFKQLSAEKINVPQLVTQIYLKLYAKYFTDEQLKVMLDFYKSPTGQHVLDVFPQLTDEATHIVNAEALPKIKEAGAQFDQEIKDGKI